MYEPLDGESGGRLVSIVNRTVSEYQNKQTKRNNVIREITPPELDLGVIEIPYGHTSKSINESNRFTYTI